MEKPNRILAYEKATTLSYEELLNSSGGTARSTHDTSHTATNRVPSGDIDLDQVWD